MNERTSSETRALTYDELLLDFVTRLDRHRAGRMACELHLHLLRPYHQQPHHLRIVRKTMEPLTRRFDAGIYEMHNRSVIVVTKGATLADVEQYVAQVRALFSEDPLFIGQDEAQFCLACFTGQYPVPVDPTLDKFIMERRAHRANLLADQYKHPELFDAVR